MAHKLTFFFFHLLTLNFRQIQINDESGLVNEQYSLHGSGYHYGVYALDSLLRWDDTET